MNSLKPITIIGGGLAGLTLGIGLRRFQIPVTIWEAGHYPRHRVCGEFVSGRGQEVLNRFGLMEEISRAGGILARTATFFLGNARSPVRPVDPPALCLSRYTLDAALADHFRHQGGILLEGMRWDGKDDIEGHVWTTGRRVQPVENAWRWFGLKIHARAAELDSDLEMHGCSAGYVGLCRLPDGEINVCGLFRSRPGTGNTASQAKSLLRGMPGTPLHRRLAGAVFQEESFCSVAGLPLRPQRAVDQQECRLGDALTMIPPVTGNGMSMAFEAAGIALPVLAAYAQGEIPWSQARRAIAGGCDAAFRSRLAWARWVQAMMFWPALQGKLGQLVLSSGWMWRLLFTRTR